MASLYQQIYNGEWMALPKRWRVGCCDCGKVHDFDFRVRKVRGKEYSIIEVLVNTNPCATGGKRKAKGVKVVKVQK